MPCLPPYSKRPSHGSPPGSLELFAGLLAAALQPGLRVIFLTALASVPEAVRAMPDGGARLLGYPGLLRSVEGRRGARAGAGSGQMSQETEDTLVGRSASLRSLQNRAWQVARRDMDGLVAAASGTGKGYWRG